MEVFRDPLMKKKFEEQGFAIFPFINEDQIGQLKALYKSVDTDYSKSDLYQTSLHNSIEENHRLYKSIQSIIHSAVEKHFENYEMFGGVYIVKTPGATSE